jgi:aspartate/methionine/tyrosine aminotransferase
MRVETFSMERMQSEFEHEVDYNLTESGVYPLTLAELLDDPGERDSLLASHLGYGESPGSAELREHIASWHPGATPDQVTVTSGGSEANYIAIWSLIERTDRAAIMTPNYMQSWGIVRGFGAAADAYRLRLREADGVRRWCLHVEDLRRVVTAKTKLILVTNPNNPTGGVMSADEMDKVIAEADRVGAWVVADEIYRGAEVASSETTGSFWGRYDRVIVTGGVAKSFGLPGLRIGWILAPRGATRDFRRHHDYTSIMPSIVSDKLAAICLKPSRRESLLERTRSILRANLPHLTDWLSTHTEEFDWVPPEAGAVLFAKAHLPVSTQTLVNRLRREYSVLLVAGEQLGGGRGLRFGFGHEIGHTIEGLARLDRLLEELR